MIINLKQFMGRPFRISAYEDIIKHYADRWDGCTEDRDFNADKIRQMWGISDDANSSYVITMERQGNPIFEIRELRIVKVSKKQAPRRAGPREEFIFSIRIHERADDCYCRFWQGDSFTDYGFDNLGRINHYSKILKNLSYLAKQGVFIYQDVSGDIHSSLGPWELLLTTGMHNADYYKQAMIDRGLIPTESPYVFL